MRIVQHNQMDVGKAGVMTETSVRYSVRLLERVCLCFTCDMHLW